MCAETVLLRARLDPKLGLAAVTIETAGNSQQGMCDATLAALVDAVAFRDILLRIEDMLEQGG